MGPRPNFDSMNETDVREVLVRPLLARLGYCHGTDATILTEKTLRYERSFLGRKNPKKDPPLTGRADYICEVISFGRWVVEVKSPSEELSQDVVEQTHTFSKLVKERKVKATDTLEEGKKRAKEAIEHSIAAQKTALDYTAKQTKAAFETAKQQLGYAGTPAGTAAESMERGMDIVLEAQKELLDLVAEPVLH